ncbi:MAG: transcriptional repressor [Tannerella sp.]|jgi:Fe2+ or Zn2+ uptake regulation protein|nr:transcriptional repressor [Tannerella sp.]
MNTGEIIKKAGLKATPQRKMLYELMTKSGHSPIDEIVAALQQQSPEFTVSTVYRILDSFCRAQLLSKTNHPNGKCYYDITPVDHHHIFADREVIDYMDPELTELIKSHLKGDLFKQMEIEKISIQIIANYKK